MQQTELPASKYGTNGRAVKMVPANEPLKRNTMSANKVETVKGSKQAIHGASIVGRDSTPALTKTMTFKKIKGAFGSINRKKTE